MAMLVFDPHDPSHLHDGVPFDHLARVRREAPVCPTPRGAWYLSRFDLVETALRDVGTFRADLGALSGLAGVEDVPDEQLFLSEITEPRHGFCASCTTPPSARTGWPSSNPSSAPRAGR
jgi:hypothetical protein